MRISFKSTKEVSYISGCVTPAGMLGSHEYKHSLEMEDDQLELELYYVEEGDGFRVVQKRPEKGEYGTLRIEVEVNGFIQGVGIYVRAHGLGDLMRMPRPGSPASIWVEAPERRVSARDGIGDWTRESILSRENEEESGSNT